jgi:hypothetical protein
MTKDGFPPDDGFPLFLSEHAEKTEQPDIGKVWDRAVVSSRILKTSILVVTATAIGIAILSVGNPVALLANATASLVGTSASQDDAQSMPTIQSTADAQVLPPTASDAPTGEEIAAASKTASQSETEIRQPPAEALLKQFQAWAAEEEAQAQVRPEQPVQDAQAQVRDDQSEVVQNAPAQVRPVQKHRHIRPVHNARAEIRPEHNARAKVRREHNPRAKVRGEQNAQVQIPPAPDARAQDQSVQNAQAPWLLQSFGWRN